jgi:hypothetical protein
MATVDVLARADWFTCFGLLVDVCLVHFRVLPAAVCIVEIQAPNGRLDMFEPVGICWSVEIGFVMLFGRGGQREMR